MYIIDFSKSFIRRCSSICLVDAYISSLIQLKMFQFQVHVDFTPDSFTFITIKLAEVVA